MTQRRPVEESVPDFVERQIREAQARGDFDDLRGSGQPLADLDRPHDDLWWVRRKLRDEHVTELPPALRARRDRDRALAAALEARDEQEVRRLVEDVNTRIREINRTAWYGPPTSVGPLDVARVLDRWRLSRPSDADEEAPPNVEAEGPVAARGVPGRRWLRRRRRRRSPDRQRHEPPDRRSRG